MNSNLQKLKDLVEVFMLAASCLRVAGDKEAADCQDKRADLLLWAIKQIEDKKS